MKNLIIIFVNFLFIINLFGQSIQNCKSCKKQIQKKHLEKYTNSTDKMKIVSNNWSEYFFENIETGLANHNEDSTNIIDLRLDALGAMYPDTNFNFNGKEVILNVFQKSKRTNFDGLSFYNISEKTYDNTKNIFWKDYLKIKKDTIIGLNSLDRRDYYRQFDYKNKWNNAFLNNQIEKVKKAINEKSIEEIILIVHGYNVPYSLAKIQSENIIEIVKNQSNNKKILFLNIFWPSTAEKTFNYEDGFFFKNNFKLSVKRNYKNVVPRTYYNAISLRKILNEVDFKGDLTFISHSLGCNLVSATLIDPNLKLSESYVKSDLREITRKIYIENPINISPKSLKVFLNAPAMGGVATFQDLNNSNKLLKTTKWFIGYNNTDRVLTRKITSFLQLREKGDNTRLGGNRNNEIEKTQILVNKLGYNGNFKFDTTGIQRDLLGHDFFCYLIQPKFQEHFKKFILNEL